MNLFETYRNHVLQAVWAVAPGVNTDAVTLEPPRDATHGDLSTNAAMVLAGQLNDAPPPDRKGDPTPPQGGSKKTNPRELAEKISARLREAEGVTKVDVAGPGFINLTLDPSVWQSMIPVILESGNSYGNSRLGAGKKINVEYVSANPTGPVHIGHARGAVYGDALATLLLKAGYNVTKEYYMNDAGAQVIMLAKSALLRYREALGEEIGEIPTGLYPGEYLKVVGQTLYAMYGRDLLREDEDHQIEKAKDVAIDAMMALIKQDLADMGIYHDVFTSEAALQRALKIEEAIEVLKKRGLIYRGVLEPPKGKKPEDWEPTELTLLRSTEYGDDSDRPVIKSNGNYAYIAGDLALAQDKFSRGFNHQILVLGADHAGYVKRLRAAALALSGGEADCHVILCQLVHLFQNGEPFKMSKRAGTFITVRDVLDEVGKDILRFVMLMRKNDQSMDFDLEKVKEQSKDNPVFYVQYAHARAKSVLRLARERVASAYHASEDTHQVDVNLLTHPAELALIKLLAAYPRLIEQAAVAHEPHRVIYFLEQLAGAFHGLWNVGSKDAEIRMVQPEQPALTTARLALARATAVVIASGLQVCGVQPVEELR